MGTVSDGHEELPVSRQPRAEPVVRDGLTTGRPQAPAPYGGSGVPGRLAWLQRAAGNRAVTSMLSAPQRGPVPAEAGTSVQRDPDNEAAPPASATETAAPAQSAPPQPASAEPAPAVPAPAAFTPSFDRQAEPAITEPPATPTVVTPLDFTPSSTAKLPAAETPLPLDSIKDTAAFWAHPEAETLAEQIAACYVTRKAKSPRDKAELQKDFDDVMQASFSRSSFGVPWWKLHDRLVAGLTKERAAFKKKKPRATSDEIELFMQSVRHKQRETVRQWEANAVWGWMVERRDRLDFETLGASGGKNVGALPDILSADQRAKIVHDKLDTLKKPLSDAEKKAALARAAKAQKKTPEQLSPEEQQAVLTAAEEAKLKGQGKVYEGTLKQARIDAEKAAENLVFPATGGFAGWQGDDKTPLHKGMVGIFKAIESEFGSFSAGTYGGMSGDHASGGFKGRFRSVDLYPQGAKNAAYFGKDVAFKFAEAIDTVAGKAGFTYQILYDDYVVVREFNAKAHGGKGAQHGRMGNQDNLTGEEEVTQQDGTKVKRPTNLNWHGPLVTHFHVDFSY